MKFYVYLHCRPDGSPFYVGKGTGYRAFVFTRYRRSKYHNNIVDKYGKQNIIIQVVDCKSEESAFELEKHLIKTLIGSGEKLCNLTDGGEGMSGWQVTDEFRRKMSVTRKGIRLSEETKKKLRDLNTGSNNARFGVKHSEETKAKIAAARRAYWKRKHASCGKCGREVCDCYLED